MGKSNKTLNSGNGRSYEAAKSDNKLKILNKKPWT